MRIFHLVEFFSPVAGYVENYLPREEKLLGNEVMIVSSYAELSRISSSVRVKINHRYLLYDGVIVKILPSIFGTYNNRPYILMRGIVKTLREFRPEVVCLPFININSLLIILLKPLLKYRIIATFGMPVIDLDRSVLKHAAYLFFRYCFIPLFSKWVDHIVEATPENFRRTMMDFCINPLKVSFIPLGSDSELFKRNEHDRKRIRGSLGIDENDVLYIYSGKIRKEKGLELLIETFSRIIPTCNRAKLLIIGDCDTKYANSIRRKVSDLKIVNYVIFHRIVPHNELPPFYSAADIAVWPGSPSISIIDAMSCSLPIIVKESGHVKHLLQYGNGFSFNNENDLCFYLKLLYNDPKLRREMGMKSRKLVEDELDWKVIALKMNKLYSA